MSLDRGGVVCSTATGTLVINGVSLHQAPAWCCPDLLSLWLPADLKGSGFVEQPEAHGGWGYAQMDAITTWTMPFALSGKYASGGTFNSNEWTGLQTNMTYLRNNIFDMRTAGVPVSSFSASLTMPSGAVRTATVRVSNWRFGEQVQSVLKTSFDLTILTGSFK